ncbi:sensor histidine kinase [Streptomyces sp. NPDC004629]|uniref:sensor histidine kinase n=1 Tax=Streptomyces sp. NPDC004629 TaxID=3364705 RepID=UPI0036CC5709
MGLLRERDEPHGHSTEPAPGLMQLPQLIASFDQVGLTVTLTQDGAAQRLSPGVDLTAYRITQEALTNVSKHALTTMAAVHLHYTVSLLTLTVTDDGPPAEVRGAAGYGLIGMRERAHAVGGHLHAHPRDETGFEVRAELPTLTCSPTTKRSSPQPSRSSSTPPTTLKSSPPRPTATRPYS